MFAASKTATTSGGYQISRSLRFNSADSAYLNRTVATTSNRQIFTFSFWCKLGTLGTDRYLYGASINGSNEFTFILRSDNILQVYDYQGAYNLSIATTQVFRDPSAWYHIVVAIDTTQATSTNRAKIYVNGTQVTALSSTTYPSQNYNTLVNSSSTPDNRIGSLASNVPNYFNGYVTEYNFIDGQALTPSSFGATSTTTGVWAPIQYTGTYGTNGFYLNFSDNSNTTAATLGKDYSGNGNNWTPNNFSVTAGIGNDSLVDNPTQYGFDTGVGGTVRGNYCTLNPIALGSATLTNGNLDASVGGDANGAYGTIGVNSGKWYWEVLYVSGTNAMIGIANTITGTGAWVNAFGWAYYEDGAKYTNNTRSAGYGASYAANAIIGVALDMDAGTLTFYKNGTSQGVAYSSLSGTMTPYLGNGGGSTAYTINLGQRPFAYTAPSGFKALCTQNLPTPVIGATSTTLATQYFNPVLYTGNGASPRTVTGVGFQPDFVWMKARSQAYVHGLANAVTGVNKFLISNSTAAETTNDAYGYLSAFNSDGFVLTAGSAANDTFNRNTDSFVAWNWKANGSGSTNTSGTITSTVSANTTSGFSIVTYASNNTAGATIGHGLGVAPSMVICRERNTGASWAVYHSALGNTKFLLLNATNAATTSSLEFNSTAPTSTVVTLGGAGSNTNDGTGVLGLAYCFAPVAGYSAFGSYTGNGSADGPFVFTGFRPAYVMFKRTDVANDWVINDATRSAYNQTINVLYANDSAAENTTGAGNSIDILSNGFKLRQTNNGSNASGGTYIFMAFASAPQKFALAR